MHTQTNTKKEENIKNNTIMTFLIKSNILLTVTGCSHTLYLKLTFTSAKLTTSSYFSKVKADNSISFSMLCIINEKTILLCL